MAASGKPNSFGKYVLEGTKLGLDFFQDFADGLPGPVKGVVGAVRRIITISEVGGDLTTVIVACILDHFLGNWLEPAGLQDAYRPRRPAGDRGRYFRQEGERRTTRQN